MIDWAALITAVGAAIKHLPALAIGNFIGALGILYVMYLVVSPNTVIGQLLLKKELLDTTIGIVIILFTFFVVEIVGCLGLLYLTWKIELSNKQLFSGK